MSGVQDERAACVGPHYSHRVTGTGGRDGGAGPARLAGAEVWGLLASPASVEPSDIIADVTRVEADVSVYPRG